LIFATLLTLLLLDLTVLLLGLISIKSTPIAPAIAALESSRRASQDDIIIKLFGHCHLLLPSSFTLVFQQSDYHMANDPSHTPLFVPSNVPDL
jgi:hypothetical protein